MLQPIDHLFLSSYQQQLCGGLLLLVSGALLALHTYYLYQLHLKISTRAGFTYYIILCIGICDFTQLSMHLFAGILSLTETNSPGWTRFFAGVMSSSWISMVLFVSLLSTQRFILTFFQEKPWKYLPSMTLGISIAVITIGFACNLSIIWVSGGIYFDVQSIVWRFELSEQIGETLSYFDLISNYFFIAYNLFLSTAIGMRFGLAKFSNGSSKLPRDFRVTMKVMPHTIVGCLIVLYWVFIQPQIEMGPAGCFIGYMLWVLWNGLNGVLNLLIHREVPKKSSAHVVPTSNPRLTQVEKSFLKSLTSKLIQKL